MRSATCRFTFTADLHFSRPIVMDICIEWCYTVIESFPTKQTVLSWISEDILKQINVECQIGKVGNFQHKL